MELEQHRENGSRQQWAYLGGGINGSTWAYEQTSGVNDRLTYNDLRIVLGWSRDQLLVQERRSLWERPFAPKSATFFQGSSSLKMKFGSKNLVTRLCLAFRRSFERRIKTARNAISFAS